MGRDRSLALIPSHTDYLRWPRLIAFRSSTCSNPCADPRRAYVGVLRRGLLARVVGARDPLPEHPRLASYPRGDAR